MKDRFISRKALGRVRLHNANAIKVPRKILFDSGNVYFDVDTLEEGKVFSGGDFLHISVGGECRVEDMRSTNVKDHIDIYIPISEIEKIKKALDRIT